MMRLTAQSDDLRTRLKTASERSMFLETQLQRIQKIAVKERSDFSKQLIASRNEVAALREADAKMKTSIVQLQQSIQKKASFESAVKSAMENKQLAEAQAKVDELTCKQTECMNQLHTLEQRRLQVVSDTKVSEAQKAEVDSYVEATNASLGEINSVLETKKLEAIRLNDQLGTYEAQHDASVKEHASIKIQSAFETKRMEKVRTEIKRLEAEREQSTFKGLNAIGDDAPAIGMSAFRTDTVFRRVDDLSSAASGMPYHFYLDAPISLTSHDTQLVAGSSERDADTDAMLSAIVGDLKTFLAQASSENDKRGINRGVEIQDQASGAVEVE